MQVTVPQGFQAGSVMQVITPRGLDEGVRKREENQAEEVDEVKLYIVYTYTLTRPLIHSPTHTYHTLTPKDDNNEEEDDVEEDEVNCVNTRALEH